MKPAIALKQKIERDELVLGTLLSLQLSAELVEVCINARMDYVIVDAEHGSFSSEQIAEVCRLGRLVNFPVILRIPRADTATTRWGMDLGPCGLMLPMVESVDELDAVAKGAYMPPRGDRRPGGTGNHWVSDVHYENFRSEVEDHLIVLPQVESPRGLEQAAAIAAHPLTTALAVGPYDLSARLGVCWQSDHPKLLAAIRELRSAAAAAGKKFWMIGAPESLIAHGLRFLCVGEPMMHLQAHLADLVGRCNEAAAEKREP